MATLPEICKNSSIHPLILSFFKRLFCKVINCAKMSIMGLKQRKLQRLIFLLNVSVDCCRTAMYKKREKFI